MGNCRSCRRIVGSFANVHDYRYETADDLLLSYQNLQVMRNKIGNYNDLRKHIRLYRLPFINQEHQNFIEYVKTGTVVLKTELTTFEIEYLVKPYLDQFYWNIYWAIDSGLFYGLLKSLELLKGQPRCHEIIIHFIEKYNIDINKHNLLFFAVQYEIFELIPYLLRNNVEVFRDGQLIKYTIGLSNKIVTLLNPDDDTIFTAPVINLSDIRNVSNVSNVTSRNSKVHNILKKYYIEHNCEKELELLDQYNLSEMSEQINAKMENTRLKNTIRQQQEYIHHKEVMESMKDMDFGID